MICNLPNTLNNDIFNVSCPNIIFYGYHIKLNEYLISVFGEFKKVTINKIIFQNNPYCKRFDIDSIKGKYIDEFFSFLFLIIKSENYYNKYGQHIIILNNYQNISSGIQNKLRVIIEKYRKTTQFIMITEKINTIIKPIRSRCLCIRIPNMNMKQKRELSKPYIKDKSYEERIPVYDKIYTLEDKKEIIQFSIYNDYLHIHEDIYLKIYKKLNEWINNNNINLSDIKEYSYNILKHYIKDIHKKLLEYFLVDPKYTFNQKLRITKSLTNSEYEYCKSYRSLVHIEKMFIEIIYVLT